MRVARDGVKLLPPCCILVPVNEVQPPTVTRAPNPVVSQVWTPDRTQY